MKLFLLLFTLSISSILFAQTTVSIYDIQYSTNGDSPYKDQIVTTTGTVTAVGTGKYWIQDGAGAWNGLYVYDNTHTPQIGDNITITGTIVEYFNLTEIKTLTNYITNSTGNSIITTNISTFDINSEAYEGVLVKVSSAICMSTPNTYGEWGVNDGTGIATVDDLIFAYTPVVSETYDITGVIDYSFSLFKLLPRNINDISVSVINPPTGNYDTITAMQYNLLAYIDTYVGCDQTNNNLTTKEAALKLITKDIKADIISYNEFGDNSTYVTRMLNNVLNTDGITYYQSSPYAAEPNTSIINMLFYNSNKFTYISENLITHSVSFVRKTKVIKLKYKNITSSNVYLYCIVTHLKAGSTSADSLDRKTMTSEIMNWMQANINTPGNYLIMGDMNLYSSNEAAYQNMVSNANTNIKMYDPINIPGDWGIYPNAAYKYVHTQSTHDEVYPGNGCHATGGLDDRFDFILMSDAIKNASQRISYMSNSYKAYGQDGNHFNLSIIDGTNSVVSPTIANALFTVSDHLPVTMKLLVSLSTTSINELDNNNNFSVYPNPAKDKLFIKNLDNNGDDFEVQIYNMIGQSLYNNQSSDYLMEIDLNNYSKGIYIINIKNISNNTSTIKKIIIE